MASSLDALPFRHIGDMVERVLALVPWWLRTKPVIDAYFSAIGAVLQQLEDDVYDAAVSELFSRAKGDRLAEWGRLFGVEPEGLDDVWYRKLILGTALARRCDGHEDRLVEIWQALTAPSIVEFRLMPQRGISLVAWRDRYMPDEYAKRAADVMRKCSPAAAIVLQEALNVNGLGFDGRTRTPLPTYLGSGIPSRIL